MSALAVGALPACGGLSRPEPGSGTCLEVADQLDAFSILSAHPADAAVVDGDAACESDGFPYATKVYRYESGETAVLDYYRQALVDDGWQRDPADFSPADPPPGEPVTLTGYHRRLGELDVICIVVLDDSVGVEPGAEDDQAEAGQSFYLIQLSVPGFEVELHPRNRSASIPSRSRSSVNSNSN